MPETEVVEMAFPCRALAQLSESRDGRISANEWNAIRPHFTHLYRDRRKTLVSIQKIMAVEYGFDAT